MPAAVSVVLRHEQDVGSDSDAAGCIGQACSSPPGQAHVSVDAAPAIPTHNAAGDTVNVANWVSNHPHARHTR